VPTDYEITKEQAQKALLSMANNFRFVKIDQCNIFRNDRHGLSAKKFYGLIHLMDTRITDNDGHGIILNTEKTNLEALN
jgi:hypothetical protein